MGWVLAGILGVVVVGGVWYIRQLLSVYRNLVGGVLEMRLQMIEFADHLNKVYNMELYYGDEVLKSLIKHSAEVTKDINEFLESIVVEQEIEKVDDEE
tara:strand:- start:182 stop:475 length:294 start_codon:yes stop_codon:yes gene_type:complete